MVEVLVYLTAKVIHIDIDYICISIEIFIPYMLQKGEAIQGRTLIQYEIFQQAVFLDRKVYRRTVTKRPVAGRVETQVATAQGLSLIHI